MSKQSISTCETFFHNSIQKLVHSNGFLRLKEFTPGPKKSQYYTIQCNQQNRQNYSCNTIFESTNWWNWMINEIEIEFQETPHHYI